MSNLAPGTPPPSETEVEVICTGCGDAVYCTRWTGLGADELNPDRCPGCGVQLSLDDAEAVEDSYDPHDHYS